MISTSNPVNRAVKADSAERENSFERLEIFSSEV